MTAGGKLDTVLLVTTPPRTYDDLVAITDPVARGRAVGDYLARLDQKGIDARKLRRDAIAEVLANDPQRGKRPTELAGEFGVSVSLVKNVRDGRA